MKYVQILSNIWFNKKYPWDNYESILLQIHSSSRCGKTSNTFPPKIIILIVMTKNNFLWYININNKNANNDNDDENDNNQNIQ